MKALDFYAKYNCLIGKLATVSNCKGDAERYNGMTGKVTDILFSSDYPVEVEFTIFGKKDFMHFKLAELDYFTEFN